MVFASYMYMYIAVPVSEGVSKERWEQRDACDGRPTVTERQQEQGLVRVKGHHTQLVSKKL